MELRPFLYSGILIIIVMVVSSFYPQQIAPSVTTPSLSPDPLLSPAIFQHPPQQYGIRCWWWWLNGNVTKEAITRDLEEMKRKGFSGASIVDAGGQNQQGNGNVPEGPQFGSIEWRALFIHAVQEAHRLGLVLSLNIQSGWNVGGPDVTPEEATKHITWSEITVAGPLRTPLTLPLPPVRDNYYKDIVVLAFPKRKDINHPPIADLAVKAAFKEGDRSGFDTEKLLNDVAASPGEEDAILQDIVVIHAIPDASGKISWQVPPGEWTIMRFGYTPSGAEVSTASGKWQGRVIDYMNATYFNRYWDTHIEPLLTTIGPLAGTTLRYLQSDSWECGGINWSDHFAEEFRQRRGYDPAIYLPVVTGKIIQDRNVSNAFLADFRKTIAECIADNHYRVFAERAAHHGMAIQPESAGPHAGPLDGLKNYSFSEIMMSEFWSPSPHRARIEDRYFVKQASSAAHIYNKLLVGAESFTTIGRHWNDIPWATMKPAFDHEVCSGLNLVFLHTFTCSPKEMGLPGQEYFAGTHINPNITWWELSTAFFDYIKRCQYIQQQPGTTVTDILYYYGDHVPNIGHLKEHDPAHILPGYDYDLINEDRLLALEVKDGRLTLPHGVNYRVLVLPETKVLSLAALQKIKALVSAGATVIGAKPERLVSLSGSPQSYTLFQQYADELWGKEAHSIGEHKGGKGVVIAGKSARQVLTDAGIAPDFDYNNISSINKPYDYIHRVVQGQDIYFVSSQQETEVSGEFSFRVTGRQPELWNPVTGEVAPAKAFRQQNGRTYIPLHFDPHGSVFVIFRNVVTAQPSAASSNATAYKNILNIPGPWQVAFNPAGGAPAQVTFENLVSWTNRTETGLPNYSGEAIYTISFNVPEYKKQQRYFLRLNSIQDVGIAEVTLNGKKAGITWTPPFRVEITDAVKAKNNSLQIAVINSWRNRLVGDRALPPEKRYTQTNITIKPEWTLLDAGLLGPVQVETIAP
ncbi:MAG TPA: glycosyl hydrolase [Ohtaekwangia sp.]|uniref:glycosyl hydrolase n=1 Tax=Ohtaekwangia sp. TaxID=2066019 RepID=UPI002F9486A5